MDITFSSNSLFIRETNSSVLLSIRFLNISIVFFIIIILIFHKDNNKNIIQKKNVFFL